MAGGKKARSKASKKAETAASTCPQGDEHLTSASKGEEKGLTTMMEKISIASDEIKDRLENRMVKNRVGRVTYTFDMPPDSDGQPLRGLDLLEYAGPSGQDRGRYWSAMAPLWELSRGNNARLEFLRDWVKNEKEWLGLPNKTHKLSLLDLACGTGLATCAFSSFVKTALGVDTAEGMLALYKEKCSSEGIAEVKTLCADWGQLFMHDDSFHEQSQLLRTQANTFGKFDIVVVCLGVSFFLTKIATVQETEAFIKILISRLNPGGTMVIVDQVTYSDSQTDSSGLAPAGLESILDAASSNVGCSFLTEVLSKFGCTDVEYKYKFNHSHPDEAIVNGIDLRELLNCYGLHYMLRARLPKDLPPLECSHDGSARRVAANRLHSIREEAQDEALERLSNVVHAYKHTDLTVEDLVKAVSASVEKSIPLDNVANHPAMMSYLVETTSFSHKEILCLIENTQLRHGLMVEVYQEIHELDNIRECFRGRLSLRSDDEFPIMQLRPPRAGADPVEVKFWQGIRAFSRFPHPLADTISADRTMTDSMNVLISLIHVFRNLEIPRETLRSSISWSTSTMLGFLYNLLPTSHQLVVACINKMTGLHNSKICQRLRENLDAEMGIMEAVHEIVHPYSQHCFCSEAMKANFARNHGELNKVMPRLFILVPFEFGPYTRDKK